MGDVNVGVKESNLESIQIKSLKKDPTCYKSFGNPFCLDLLQKL